MSKKQAGMFYIHTIATLEGGYIWLLCVEDTIYRRAPTPYGDPAEATAAGERFLREELNKALAALPAEAP
jgi:hypothetical protein